MNESKWGWDNFSIRGFKTSNNDSGLKIDPEIPKK